MKSQTTNYYHYYFLLALQLVLTHALLNIEETRPDQLQDLLFHIENDQDIQVFDFLEAVVLLDVKLEEKTSNSTEANKYMGTVLNHYAKSLFYGRFNNYDPEIQKAYYYFKLASSFDNAESQYYLSFYSFYGLDGSFLYESNSKLLNDSMSHIKNYIKDLPNVLPTTKLDSPKLEESQISTLLNANIHLKGIHVEKNYESAASYFKSLAKSLIKEDDDHTFYIFNEDRLDDLYLHKRKSGIEKSDDNQKDSVEELTLQNLESIDLDLLQAKIYYQKREYTKAYELLLDLINQKNLDAMVMAGDMLIKGTGIEVNIQAGLEYLESAAQLGSLEAKNNLGVLYSSDRYIKQDQKLSAQYFKEAAYSDHPDAQYNYGILLLNDKKETNNAMDLIESASSQGNKQALIHLGLNLLDRKNQHYNCELGLQKLKRACEKGPWMSKIQDAFISYKVYQNTRLASIYYMEAALLGYDIASPNGALLINKYHPFTIKDIDVEEAKRSITKDPLWNVLLDSNNFKPLQITEELFHEEVALLLGNLGYTYGDHKTILKQLTTIPKEAEEEFNDLLVVKMLSIGAKVQDSLSLIKLGDLYYEGVAVEKNYTKAYEYYTELKEQIDGRSNHDMLPKVLENLAYMNHHGLGKSRNLTEAVMFYAASLNLDKANYYQISLSLSFAEWEEVLRIDIKPLQICSEIINTINLKIKAFEDRYAKKIFAVFLMMSILVLYLFRLRLSNFSNEYFEQKKNK